MIREDEYMKNKLSTSVVLTTYNGEKYIVELLDSLRLQTLEIDEVLIFDDNSQDNTIKIINKYILEYDLSRWKLFINSKNLGWEANFAKGLLSAQKDIIFPCDQDDIWMLDKVEKLVDVFSNSKCCLVASDYALLRNDAYKIVDQNIKRDYTVHKVAFDRHFYYIKRPGCTMAFRKEMLKFFEVTWREGTPHDAILWEIAGLMDGLYLFDKPLIYYRRHENNASNAISHEYKYKLNEAKRTLSVLEWYVKSEFYDSNKEKIIKNCIEWCLCRVNLLEKHKIMYCIVLLKYRKNYISLKKLLADFYYSTKRDKR